GMEKAAGVDVLPFPCPFEFACNLSRFAPGGGAFLQDVEDALQSCFDLLLCLFEGGREEHGNGRFVQGLVQQSGPEWRRGREMLMTGDFSSMIVSEDLRDFP